MKLNRDKLKETVKNGIEHAKMKQIEWDENVDAAEKEHERKWREETLPQYWKPLRDQITRSLRTGEPITRDMLPISDHYYEKEGKDYKPFNRGEKDAYGRWYASHKYGPRPILQIAPFESLLDFLETIEEESITTSQLERAGFRNLNKLFEAAANGYWTD